MALHGSTTFTRAVACLGVLAAANGARAEGIETTVSGTVGLGRAANVVRVNDFMATWQNPANLAVVPSNDLGAELRLPLLHGCFDRIKDPNVMYRTMDEPLGLYGSESFAPVCNKASFMPAGNLGWAQAFESGWGYGIGFFTPAAVPNLEYGSDLVVSQAIPDDPGATLTGEESPTRFLLLKRQQLGGFVQAGAGFRLSSLVRVGASLGWGFATLSNRSIASVQGGTFQDQEVLNDIRVSDGFIPRAMASVVVTPLPSLELMASLTYQGDVSGTGDVDIDANGIHGATRGNCRVPAPQNPGPSCSVADAKLTAPFPRLSATLGVRYAALRAGRERALDPMKDERWDIELNASWSETSHVDKYSVTLFDGPPPARIAFASADNAMALALPAKLTIPYNWKDTLGLRLGGDYNLLPELLAVRAGLSYESNAIPTAYMNIDSWAVTRVGLHVGGTVKLGQLKLSIAYAHIFFGSVTVPLGTGKVREIVSANPMAAQAVNEGDYSASLNVISGQVNYAF